MIANITGTWTDPEFNEITYERWRDGEPNGDIVENGAIMYMFSHEDWIDVKVDETYGYLCKAAIGKNFENPQAYT